MRLPAVLAVALAALFAAVPFAAPDQNPFLGRWNMTGTGEDSTRVYWLEVSEANGQLSAMFLNRGGHPRPPAEFALEGNELTWAVAAGGGDNPTFYRFSARVENGQLVGTETLPARGRRGGAAAEPRVVNFVGVRPPSWPPANANGAHTYGEPVVLFGPGSASLDAFTGQFPNRELGWTVEDGVMNNGDGANNLVSRQTFRDFKVEAEYRLAEASNSGIYLRGRYELQVFEDHGDEPFDRGHMSIYGRVAPTVNASRPTGEWQQMEAVIVGNRVTVTLNGQRVHDNVVIDGITGGALNARETEPGPLMIQGDHSGVWFRRVVVTPITAAGRE